MKSLEKTVESVIEGKMQGGFAFFLRGLLRLLSLFYQAGSTCRNLCYEWKLLPTATLPLPIVSIGNLVAGGTGKTPLVLWLARSLQAACPVGILFRGYRSEAERSGRSSVLSIGNGPLLTPQMAGDEAFLCSRNLPNAIVICGKDRVQSGQLAMKLGAKVLIVDDGFQHRRLARDFNILLLDGKDPFGKRKFLPAGYLRESPKAIERAQWIIINNAPDLARDDRSAIRSYNKEAPIIGIEPLILSLCDAKGRVVANRLDGKKIGVFCGIAKPYRFFKALEPLGAEVVFIEELADHKGWQKKDFEAFTTKCALKGAEFIVCTEKDIVKLPEEWASPLPVLWAQLSFRMLEGEKDWVQLTEKIKTLVEQHEKGH